MARPARYWDSCCFLYWLDNTVGFVDECKPVIRAAEAGELYVVTSSITLTEVIKLKGKPSLTQDKEATIRAFFKNSWIIVRQLDRRTAEFARQLIWDHGFQPKDSIHVATAVLARLPRLDTFDGELIKRSGGIGNPPLIIGRPDLPYQPTLEDSEDE